MNKIEHIKLSQQAKDYLVRLKSKTGIKHWNVLCRWAFCVSLAEPSNPPQVKIPADSNVEMNWKTFGGQHHEIYLSLLKQRCKKDGFALTDDILAEQFRIHLHRGIGYLFADKTINDISSLMLKVESSMKG
jgi:DNA sulfur modification protein DndE